MVARLKPPQSGNTFVIHYKKLIILSGTQSVHHYVRQFILRFDPSHVHLLMSELCQSLSAATSLTHDLNVFGLNMAVTNRYQHP